MNVVARSLRLELAQQSPAIEGSSAEAYRGHFF